MYMCDVGMHMHVCAHVEARSQHQLSSFVALHLSF